MSKTQSSEFFTVGPVPLAFPSLFESSSPRGSNAAPRYNVNILVTMDQYQNVIVPQMNAFIAKAFPNGESQNPNFTWPFYECKYKAETYPGGAEKGMLHGNLKSMFQTEVVDSARQPILDPGLIRDGAICYVSMNFYSWTNMGKSGISAGLGPVMYVRDGEALNVSAGGSASSAFAGIEVNTSVPQTARVETPAPMPTYQAPSAPSAPVQQAPVGNAPPPPPPGR